MASGRMLRRNITKSKKIAQISERSRCIYMMLLPYTDRDGRLNAHPTYLKGAVFLHLEYSEADLTQTLLELEKVGLISLYSTDEEEAILEVADFKEHNTPDKKEAASEFPAPDSPEVRPCTLLSKAQAMPEQSPGNAGAMPEQCGRNAPPEVKVKVKDKVKDKDKDNTLVNFENNGAEENREPPVVLQKDAKRRARIDYQEFFDIYNQHRGFLPAVSKINDKRRRSLRRLVDEHGYHESLALLSDATKCVANDEYWIERQYNFDNLVGVSGRVVEKAEKNRAQGFSEFSGGASAADKRLAIRAKRIAEAIGWDGVSSD